MASSFPLKKNSATRIVFPILDADGDPVSGAAGLDSEYSLDGGAFSDCASEATEIGSSGIYYLDLAAGETNGDVVCIQVKTTTSGAKTTVLVFYTAAQTLDETDIVVDAITILIDALNDPTAAGIADAVWDEVLTGATHNLPTSAGRRLRQAADVLIAREETCQAGGANNAVIFDAGASAVDNFYQHDGVILISGVGVGQSRHIDSYVGATRTATVNRDWTTNPDATTGYAIRFDSPKHLHHIETLALAQIQQEAEDALAAYAVALEATLTAIKGVGWTNETLKLLKELVDELETGEKPKPKANFDV